MQNGRLVINPETRFKKTIIPAKKPNSIFQAPALPKKESGCIIPSIEICTIGNTVVSHRLNS